MGSNPLPSSGESRANLTSACYLASLTVLNSPGHLLGTARMGLDPDRSVVNEWGREPAIGADRHLGAGRNIAAIAHELGEPVIGAGRGLAGSRRLVRHAKTRQGHKITCHQSLL
jgi:hypothetical protein